MNLNERIESIAFLGEVIRNGLSNIEPAEEYDLFTENFKLKTQGAGTIGTNSDAGISPDRVLNQKLLDLINNQHIENPWFTPGNVRLALNAIALSITEANLEKWVSHYPWLSENRKPVEIGVVMAGNIPLVGFHDFISVLITGNRIKAKMSSKDSVTYGLLTEILCSRYPEMRSSISFTDENLTGFDAIIATGSNNSSRYFEYYFGKYPHIIRKNRNSIAIFEGNETDEELERSGADIFSYFGLGCRNVSKIYVPGGYDFDRLINSWKSYGNIIRNNKYGNNYDHNKALFLVNRERFYDMGFVLLKEESSLSSPVSVIHFEYYDNYKNFTEHIDNLKESIQCITGHGFIPFGEAQYPQLWNYADGTDTIEFIGKIKK